MRALSGYPEREIAICALLVAMLAAGVGTYVVRDEYRRLTVAKAMTGGDPARAPDLFRRYGCSGCHVIPGIAGASGKVGGSLEGLRERVFIAGVLNNTPDNLIGWIVSPQRFSPRTAMPATGVSEEEARDLAAYLYAR